MRVSPVARPDVRWWRIVSHRVARPERAGPCFLGDRVFWPPFVGGWGLVSICPSSVDRDGPERFYIVLKS
jgi:hypothetical protein